MPRGIGDRHNPAGVNSVFPVTSGILLVLLLSVSGCSISAESDIGPVSYRYTRLEVDRAARESNRLFEETQGKGNDSRIVYLWAKATGFCHGMDCVGLQIIGTRARKGRQEFITDVSVHAVDPFGEQHTLGTDEFEPFVYSLSSFERVDAAARHDSE